MTPEEFAARFRASRGLNLGSTPVPTVPIPPPAAIPAAATAPPPPLPMPPPPPPTAPPIRTNPDGTLAGNLTSNRIDNPDVWKTGAPPSVPAPPPPSAVPPPPMPQQAEPTPYAPPGVSLTSTPSPAPQLGWAGTVGQTEPAAAPAAIGGTNYDKLMSGLDDVAKGLKPKAPTPSPFPNLIAEQPNQPNSMAMQLMAAIMAGKNRGLTLTGR